MQFSKYVSWFYKNYAYTPSFDFVHEIEILDADQECKHDKDTYSDV